MCVFVCFSQDENEIEIALRSSGTGYVALGWKPTGELRMLILSVFSVHTSFGVAGFRVCMS